LFDAFLKIRKREKEAQNGAKEEAGASHVFWRGLSKWTVRKRVRPLIVKSQLELNFVTFSKCDLFFQPSFTQILFRTFPILVIRSARIALSMFLSLLPITLTLCNTFISPSLRLSGVSIRLQDASSASFRLL
jgi:hypothetical protein